MYGVTTSSGWPSAIHLPLKGKAYDAVTLAFPFRGGRRPSEAFRWPAQRVGWGRNPKHFIKFGRQLWRPYDISVTLAFCLLPAACCLSPPSTRRLSYSLTKRRLAVPAGGHFTAMEFDYSKLKSPAYFAENRVPAHSDHVAYRNMDELAAGESGLRHSLNGWWKFCHALNPK